MDITKGVRKRASVRARAGGIARNEEQEQERERARESERERNKSKSDSARERVREGERLIERDSASG